MGMVSDQELTFFFLPIFAQAAQAHNARSYYLNALLSFLLSSRFLARSITRQLDLLELSHFG